MNLTVNANCGVNGGQAGVHALIVPVVIFGPSFPDLVNRLPLAMRTPLVELSLTCMLIHEREYVKAVAARRIQGGVAGAAGKSAYHGVIAHYQSADMHATVRTVAATLGAANTFLAARALQCVWDRKTSAG